MLTLLHSFFPYILTLHIFAMAIGLGGATVSDILFFKFLNDYKISKKEVEVLHVLKDVIMGAMLIITLSGLGLYLPNMAAYNTSAGFMLKATITGVVLINGIALHMVIAPHMLKLNLHQKSKLHIEYRKLAFALGAISVTSWYSAFLLAMLKNELTFTYIQGLIGYVVLIILAITGSQLLGWYLVRKARN
jgi:hypothetical protein